MIIEYVLIYILDRKILSGHDVSDGGLIVCLLEMAFAGNRSTNIDIPFGSGIIIYYTMMMIVFLDEMTTMFAEELGVVLEINDTNIEQCLQTFVDRHVFACRIGSCDDDRCGPDAKVYEWK